MKDRNDTPSCGWTTTSCARYVNSLATTAAAAAAAAVAAAAAPAEAAAGAGGAALARDPLAPALE